MTNPNERAEQQRDPLVDEVRGIRRGLSERFNNDVNALCDHLREVERKYAERVVKRADAKRAAG